jgi:hypothetical protein
LTEQLLIAVPDTEQVYCSAVECRTRPADSVRSARAGVGVRGVVVVGAGVVEVGTVVVGAVEVVTGALAGTLTPALAVVADPARLVAVTTHCRVAPASVLVGV